MTNAKRQNPKPFTPREGTIYENAGGGRYLCESSYEDRSAWMTNVSSGWSFIAKGIVQYDDKTIEWDYSTNGQFLPIDGARLARINRANIQQRQRSLMNAMLCCFI